MSAIRWSAALQLRHLTGGQRPNADGRRIKLSAAELNAEYPACSMYQFEGPEPPDCVAGEFGIIAAILERPVIEKIFTGLGLDPQPQPTAPAREPGQHQTG